MLEALQPIVIQSLMVIIPAATAWAVAWFRSRAQRSVVEQATVEAEAAGHRQGLRGVKKKELAMTLSSERMGAFTRPSPERLEEMVEDAVPQAAITVPPPR